jgi:predicted aminopeptidase
VVDDWANDQVLGRFWERTARALDSAYASWPDDSSARVSARDSVYARARRLLVDSVSLQVRGINPAWFHRIPLDNASLLARRVYSQRLDLFDSVLVRNGSNVRQTIAAVRDAVRDSSEPFVALERIIRVP